MKTCFKCHKEKELTEFYKHPQMKDGRVNKCKECNCNDVQLNRLDKLEQYTIYEKERNIQPHRRKARRDYQKTDAGKIAHSNANKTYQENYPNRKQASTIARNAIRDGKLTRGTSCVKCESTNKIEGHHCDYTKPLDLMWLCEPCHKQWHRDNTPVYE